jgi:ketosteroid isomerase-like protein
MHPNAQLITRFYEAFSRRDGLGMAACYHPEASFQDPAFTLQGEQVGRMWRMLCERGKDLTLTFSDVTADDSAGSTKWEAHYTFSATKRPVHNIIQSSFTFRDGLIHTQNDVFDFWRWSRQALGAPGIFLGWSSFLQSKVQAQAMAGLAAWKPKE